MEILSEDRIKKTGLRFLKSYYRQRERSGSGETHARYDVQTEAGIIADGHLSFETIAGMPFSATMEATSALTKDEVKYRMQNTRLFWDSLTVSSLLSALVFSYSYAFNHFTIKQIGLIQSFFLLAILIFVIGFIYQAIVRGRSRYHYIYAIEQFKKYHADEQWIAIGEDVFEHREDEIYLELRDQCIISGFGLIEIDFDENATLLVTPSRNEIFGEKRDSLSFETRDVASKRSRVARYSKVWNEKIAGRLKIPGADRLKRYQTGYFREIMLTSFGFLLIGGIFHMELADEEMVYMDEGEYKKQMKAFKKETYPETDEYLLDSAALDLAVEAEGYLTLAERNNSVSDPIWKTQEVKENFYSAKDILEIQAIPNKPFDLIISSQSGRQTRYNCERLFNLSGKHYLVLDHKFIQPRRALKRMAQLISADIPVSTVNLNCLESGKSGYLVYYDVFFGEKKDAKKAAAQFKRLLKEKGFTNKRTTIYTVEVNR